MWVVVPVKDLSRAKRRLSPRLEPAERRSLAVAMLRDVLEAARSARGVEGVLVITDDRKAAAIARENGAEICAEKRPSPSADGAERGEAKLNRALQIARRWLRDRDAGALLVLPADLPLATTADIEALAALDPGVTDEAADALVALVPDRTRGGTNALLLRPPNAIPFCFGRDSARHHRRLAEERGIRFRELDLGSLRLDVDEPSDLEALTDARAGRSTAFVLDQLPLANLAPTPHESSSTPPPSGGSPPGAR